MTWNEALRLVLTAPGVLCVFDANNDPHWIEMSRHDVPQLCTEAYEGAFSKRLEPYSSERSIAPVPANREAVIH